MKHFLYLMIAISVLSIGSLFVLKSPNGQPWLKPSDFINPQAITTQFTSVKNSTINKANTLFHKETDSKVYQWQDEQGVWHYSDSPNANSHTWTKPNNLTVIPATKLTNQPNAASKSENTLKKINAEPLSTNKVKKLMNDTHNVQQLMNNRTKVIDEHLNQ